MSTSKFEWKKLEGETGSDTYVAFVAGGAVVRSREWTRDGDVPTDAVALVFIPGATRADFFGEDTNAPR